MRLKAVTVVVGLAAVLTGAARASTTFVVTGHGWGHGVGMSQWGAYGYALHGWGYKRILAHYYPGTELKKTGEPYVRVLLAQGVGVVTVGCATQITVTDGRRFTRHLPAKTYGVGPKLAIPVRHRHGTHPFGRGFAEFSCARSALTFDGRPYRGRLIVRSDRRSLSVVNVLSVDEYVRGVVPSESPAKWPLAELEAQAVAARSYALAELKPSSRYDLVPDTRNQVYGGMSAERPRSNQAVEETLGQILTYHGAVARTYYSSSSGGRTESSQDAWPGSAPIPYLPSVSDPWDTYSPNHDWGPFVYSASRLGGLLGAGGSIASTEVQRDSSERVTAVRLYLEPGRHVTVSGAQVASALGLRSTWFSIGALTLTTSTQHALYGASVRVVARAFQAQGAVLQQELSDGRWRTLGHVHGRSVFSVAPRSSTAFRLRMPGVSGDPVAVAVRPQLHAVALGPRLLGGKLVPRDAGPVEVLRFVRGEWRVVAHPRLLANGTFRTPLRLRPTVYRITAGSGEFAPAERRLVITRRLLASMTG